MTHTMGTFYVRMVELIFDAATNRRFMQTEIEAMLFNYGVLEFFKDKKGEKKVKI